MNIDNTQASIGSPRTRSCRGQARQHQSGGTILGLIIGMVIGLSIALGVALVITKSPVPFLSKLNRQEKPPALTPSQAADPNKPMYGNKEPAKEAAKEFAKAEEPVKIDPAVESVKLPGIPATTPATIPPAVDKTKPADKTASANAANAAAVNTGRDPMSVPPKMDAPEEKWVYYLQAGAFREQVDADSAKAKLALAGFDAGISERNAESGSLYRVRIGPFTNPEAMNRARVKLSDNGVDVAVVKIAK
ncbi:SPOR domain-containing protein [soil metagenome]